MKRAAPKILKGTRPLAETQTNDPLDDAQPSNANPANDTEPQTSNPSNDTTTPTSNPRNDTQTTAGSANNSKLQSATQESNVAGAGKREISDDEQNNPTGETFIDIFRKQEMEIDLSGDHGKEFFCRNISSALFPLNFVLGLIGRYPLHGKRRADSFHFEYSINPVLFVYFHVITIVLLAILGLSLYSAFVVASVKPGNYLRGLTLDSLNKVEKSKYRRQIAYDHVLIQRNGIPLIIIYATLVQAIVHSFVLTFRISYLAHIFSFLNKAAYSLHMDLGEKVRSFSVRLTVASTIITSVFIMLSALKFGPSAWGAPMVFGSMLVRPFYEIVRKVSVYSDPVPSKWLFHLSVRCVGGAAIVLIYICAVGPILLFIFSCKVLRNGFAFWNGRAYCALLRGYEHAQTSQGVLLDLLDSINKMYGHILESYFLIQLMSMVIQVYFLFRTTSQKVISNYTKPYKEDAVFYYRPYDWVPAGVVLVASSLLLICAGHAAGEVATEGQAGQEVIRRKGMMGRKTDQELEFMFNMNFSFQSCKTVQVIGAGWIPYNNAFLVVIIGNILFYFTLVHQFRVSWDYSSEHFNLGYKNPHQMGIFLKASEGSQDHKNQWSNKSTGNLLWSSAF